MGSNLALPFLLMLLNARSSGQRYQPVVPPGGWPTPPKQLSTPGHTQGERRTNPIDGTLFVWVPAGPFLFGPKNERRYTKGFWMARSVVTNRQFSMFCKATGFIPFAERSGKAHKKMRLKRPVNTENFAETDVNYDVAVAYAKWARCAIPTEEMWEKAARGTDGRKYPWGNAVHKPSDRYMGSPPPEDEASPYGCLGMVNCVAQWTSSGSLARSHMSMGRYDQRLIPHQIVKGFSDCAQDDLVEARISPLYGFRLAVSVDQ